MSAVTATLAGRRAAERNMVDACTVTRAGSSTTDDLTGAVTSTPTTLYTGKCKVQQLVVLARRHDIGEASMVVLRLDVHLPVVGSETIRRGDLVTITASKLDAALVGKVFRVHDESHKSMATARRLGVEEVT